MADNMFQNPLSRWFGAGAKAGKPRTTVLVKQLQERDRRRILKHFLGLDDSDRLLRFGTVLPDAQVEAYVAKINFAQDTVYGVVNRVFRLVAVGHLAFAPKEQVAMGKVSTDKDKVAEYGVSVSRSARGLGIGSKLFERAAIHCRNSDVDTLYMHCLASNQTMIHIAKKAGMAIQREYGEADAYLRLLPANPASMLQEALEEQFATIDYTLKANTRAAVKFFETKK
jgi:GNAT superfamily N-acetyltransferase